MWLTKDQLEEIGFKAIGSGVLIDSGSYFFAPENISIGDNSRIDAGAILSSSSGAIDIGKHVHIAAGVKIYGQGEVRIEDYVGISVNTVVLSATDDFIEGYMTNPTVPDVYRKVRIARVEIGRHAIIGANSTILPGTKIELGASIGACTLVKGAIEPFAIVAGNPARPIGRRNAARLLELEKLHMGFESQQNRETIQ